MQVLKKPEMMSIAAFAVAILLVPMIPTGLIMLLDNILIRCAIILAAIYAVMSGPIEGLLTLLLIGLLFIERNRRKVAIAAAKLDAMDQQRERPATVAEAAEPQKTVPVRPFQRPADSYVEFVPGPETGSNQFEPVSASQSLNHKAALAVVPNGAAAQKIYLNGGLASDTLLG